MRKRKSLKVVIHCWCDYMNARPIDYHFLYLPRHVMSLVGHIILCGWWLRLIMGIWWRLWRVVGGPLLTRRILRTRQTLHWNLLFRKRDITSIINSWSWFLLVVCWHVFRRSRVSLVSTSSPHKQPQTVTFPYTLSQVSLSLIRDHHHRIFCGSEEEEKKKTLLQKVIAHLFPRVVVVVAGETPPQDCLWEIHTIGI